ncbi:hypothetical protein BMAJHU_0626, partial [Burkholderia mallei JHU]
PRRAAGAHAWSPRLAHKARSG